MLRHNPWLFSLLYCVIFELPCPVLFCNLLCVFHTWFDSSHYSCIIPTGAVGLILLVAYVASIGHNRRWGRNGWRRRWGGRWRRGRRRWGRRSESRMQKLLKPPVPGAPLIVPHCTVVHSHARSKTITQQCTIVCYISEWCWIKLTKEQACQMEMSRLRPRALRSVFLYEKWTGGIYPLEVSPNQGTLRRTPSATNAAPWSPPLLKQSL